MLVTDQREETECYNRGRDWKDTATSPEMPKECPWPRSCKSQGTDSHVESLERV